jgi:phage protein D
MEAEVCCRSGALISLQMGYDGRKVLKTCVSL